MPLIWAINEAANGLLRVLGVRLPSEDERVHTPQEIMMLVRRQGLLGGKNYSLRLTWFDDQQKVVYTRGDKFLPVE